MAGAKFCGDYLYQGAISRDIVYSKVKTNVEM